MGRSLVDARESNGRRRKRGLFCREENHEQRSRYNLIQARKPGFFYANRPCIFETNYHFNI
jgi:hypothetical protein